MTIPIWAWIGAGLGGLVLVSYLIEALRKPPSPPQVLSWLPGIPVSYLEVEGARLRYIRMGAGPALVLIHTLRLQLDIFQKVISELARDFTVYAVDLPGHGWSDIPEGDYTPEFFSRYVAGFLRVLDLKGVLVVGVSIGASIPMLLAAQGHPGVGAVVAINPYDYGKRGIARANLVARLFFTVAPIPVIGGAFMRLRNRLVEGKILDGGVADPAAIPAAFREEVFRVGERPNHYQAFLSLIRHMPLWAETHSAYPAVGVPVRLVYGDHDWSREHERQRTAREIPGASLAVVENGGHFLPLDQPQAVIQQIRSFASERAAQRR